MFSALSPALNIHALADWLKSQHVPGYLYRGQTHDYPAIIPSQFRALAHDATYASSMVGISREGFDKNYASSLQARTKWRVQDFLIRNLGIAVGNIIGQQYGLTSECTDVTEDINIASYFATRKYPAYEHFDSSELGVIYRFVDTDNHGLSPSHSIDLLNSYFEMGQSSRGYFDFFIRKDQYEHAVFDRDKWLEYQPAARDTVWTLPLALSWSQIRALIEASLDDLRHKALRDDFEGYFIKEILNMDWRKTRFESQKGGLIRPRIYWEASVASDFQVAGNRKEMFAIRGGLPGLDADFGSLIDVWPMVVPSAAIKENLIGVENIKTRLQVESFYFRHGSYKVSGIYRRVMWPEPAEDPLYAVLWYTAMRYLIAHSPEGFPAIDDPEKGILDRGYRVTNEQATHDARAIEDLMRGQLEDATEFIQLGNGDAHHRAIHATALHFLGRTREAVLSTIKGLKVKPFDADLLFTLAECLNSLSKRRWAQIALSKAIEADPAREFYLYSLALYKIEDKKFSDAAALLDKAIALATETKRIDINDILAARMTVAHFRGETGLYEEIEKKLDKSQIEIVLGAISNLEINDPKTVFRF